MNRTDIIEQADSLSERKGKQLDLKLLYTRRLQKLSRRYRFWWRKCYAVFTLPIGTTSVDLMTLTSTAVPTGNGLVPATAFTEVGVEEVVTLERIDSATSNPPALTELDPVIGSDGFIEMLVGVTPSKPGRYIFDYGDYKTLRLDSTDAAYQFVLTFWGMPNPGKDSAIDAVPLIPPWYHDVIVDGMVMDIFAKSYGEQNLKTVAAKEDYEAGIVDMIMRPQYTGKLNSQLITNESAVRSTPGRAQDIGAINIPPPR